MDITQQQCFLGGLGYYDLRYREPPRMGDLAIDGISGPVLMGAIRRFQQEHRQRPDGSELQEDGIWGPATEEALRQVIGAHEPPQTVPEPAAPETPAEGEYPWLVDWEALVRCRCGGRFCTGLPDQGFSTKTLELANEVGRRLGVRLRCTSGYRCPEWNARIPGASPRSCHMRAIAFDCNSEDGSVSPQRLFDTADAVVGDQGGVGVYPWGIHLDSRGYRARWDSR